jgi:transcriptional regulator with XRE-family HTH domain
MVNRDSVASVGARRSRLLRLRIGEELGVARRTSGLSVREVARCIGVGDHRVARAERGDAGALTLDLAARIAPAVGLIFASQLYAAGDPVRDRAHLELINRLRHRLGAAARLRVEVPVPIAGDRRGGDAMLATGGGDVLIEAETHLGDLQSIERKAAAKARDLAAIRLVLLVADTKHNRAVIRLHPELRERFPISARACLAALSAGRDPGGDGMVML